MDEILKLEDARNFLRLLQTIREFSWTKIDRDIKIGGYFLCLLFLNSYGRNIKVGGCTIFFTLAPTYWFSSIEILKLDTSCMTRSTVGTSDIRTMTRRDPPRRDVESASRSFRVKDRSDERIFERISIRRWNKSRRQGNGERRWSIIDLV